MKKSKYQNFKVMILGEKWDIKFISPVLDTQGNRACGVCDYPFRTMLIDPDQDKKMVLVTMIHELFHAYVRRSGIYNGNLSPEMEEIIADQFATVMVENFDFKL